MNRLILKNIIVLVILCFVFFFNCIPTAAKTTSVGIDKSKIDEFVKSRMKAENIPGVSIAIVKDTKVFYLKGYGDAGNSRLVTPQTPFILGSVSKSFTGLAILQLVEKGEIDLNAPVVQYLPWFRLKDLDASKKITIQNLLRHTSGLSTLSGNEADVGEKANISIEQLVRNQANTEISKPVNTTFQYSNLNYIILGEIIQSVTGESYEKYITDNIYKPLNMKHSYASVEKAKKNGLSSGYNSFLGFMISTKEADHKSAVPAGYLSSSSEDLSHYLIAEMNGGSYNGHSIISNAGMKQTHEPLNKPKKLVSSDGKTTTYVSTYGMGWFNNFSLIAHDGDTENFHSDVIMYNDGNWGIAILCNSNDAVLTTITNREVYRDLWIGTLNILRGMDPNANNPPSTTIVRTIINAIQIFIFMLLLFAIFRLLKWKKRINLHKLNLSINLAVLAVVNILIPILIITVLPIITIRFFNSTISEIITYVPDLGKLIILVPLILLIIGVVKLVLLISLLINRVRTNTNNLY